MQRTTESWIDFRRRIERVNPEKRKCPRLEFHCPVKIQGVKGIQRITDIGMRGVFVECAYPSPLQRGQIVDLAIKLPTEHDHIRVKAEVADMRDRGIGFRFVNLTPANRDSIRFCFNTFKDTLPLR